MYISRNLYFCGLGKDLPGRMKVDNFTPKADGSVPSFSVPEALKNILIDAEVSSVTNHLVIKVKQSIILISYFVRKFYNEMHTKSVCQLLTPSNIPMQVCPSVLYSLSLSREEMLSGKLGAGSCKQVMEAIKNWAEQGEEAGGPQRFVEGMDCFLGCQAVMDKVCHWSLSDV